MFVLAQMDGVFSDETEPMPQLPGMLEVAILAANLNGALNHETVVCILCHLSKNRISQKIIELIKIYSEFIILTRLSK